jgi:hypothetical protein
MRWIILLYGDIPVIPPWRLVHLSACALSIENSDGAKNGYNSTFLEILSAALSSVSKDGQILLSQRVNVALRGTVATEQVGALALKGLTQPVVAYNVPLVGSQAAFRVIEGGTPST